jgi:hypothetical protein
MLSTTQRTPEPLGKDGSGGAGSFRGSPDKSEAEGIGTTGGLASCARSVYADVVISHVNTCIGRNEILHVAIQVIETEGEKARWAVQMDLGAVPKKRRVQSYETGRHLFAYRSPELMFGTCQDCMLPSITFGVLVSTRGGHSNRTSNVDLHCRLCGSSVGGDWP